MYLNMGGKTCVVTCMIRKTSAWMVFWYERRKQVFLYHDQTLLEIVHLTVETRVQYLCIGGLMSNESVVKERIAPVCWCKEQIIR